MEEKIDKFLDNFWPVVIAFLLGRLNVFEEPLFAVSYGIATAIYRKNVWSCYVAIILAMFSTLNFERAIIFSIIIAGIAFTTSIRDVVWLKTQAAMLAICGAGWYLAVRFIAHVVFGYGYGCADIAVKSVVVFAVAMIYEKAMEVLDKDIISVVSKADAGIAVLITMGITLYAIPIENFGVIILQSVTVLGMLYVGYRFGMGLGLTWSVISGFVVAIRLHENSYIAAYTIIMIATLGVFNFVQYSRIIYALFFVSFYSIAGFYGYSFLFELENIKASVSACFIFLCLPVRYVLPVDDKVKYDSLSKHSPEWANLVMERVGAFARALKRVDYTMADASTGISFGEIGNIIDSFTESTSQKCPIRKTVEAKVIQELKILGVNVQSLLLIRNSQDKFEVYITLKCRGNKLVSSVKVKEILEREMKVSLIADEGNRNLLSKEYMMFVFHEKPMFQLATAVRFLSRYEDEPSGDNYYIGNVRDGQKLVMISDGMGSGLKASEASQNLIDAMEELLMAGIDNQMAIKLVNMYLSEKNKGEIFATMDMLLVDLYTGQGRLFKQGAATTYIKRRKWIEEIKSTSLPMGVDEEACCEQLSKKIYNQDIILMLSDGVYEDLIYENKEDYIRNLLINMEYDDVEQVADYIIENVTRNSRKELSDDATIIVCKLMKTA